VGPSPTRTVISQAIKIMLGTSMWTAIDSHHYVWNFRPNGMVVSQDRLAILKAHATLCALHVLWLGALPPQVSVPLIVCAMRGFSNLLMLSFIKVYCPKTATKLEGWPIDSTSVLDLSLGSPTLTLALEYLPQVTVSFDTCV
jgi:hypothetical protein